MSTLFEINEVSNQLSCNACIQIPAIKFSKPKTSSRAVDFLIQTTRTALHSVIAKKIKEL